MREPIIVEFPLRGEWYSPNTPGTRIPSHGTDQLGMTYAFDFIQVEWERKGWPAYNGNLLQYLLSGITLNEYFCWGQEIYAPCDGTLIPFQKKRQSRWIGKERSRSSNTKKYRFLCYAIEHDF